MTKPESIQGENPEDEVPLRDRPIEEVATVLQEVLGQRLTAFGLGEKDPTRIGVFAKAEDIPTEDQEKVLRDMAEVVEVLTKEDSPEVARAIMVGMNPYLGDKAPIEMIHSGYSQIVVEAAPHLNP